MKEEITVHAGVCVHEGRVLLVQRSPNTSYPLYWVFPGGREEPGETGLQTLVRELSEELGINPVPPFAEAEMFDPTSICWESEEKTYNMRYWVIHPGEMVGTTFTLDDPNVIGVGWFEPLFALAHLRCTLGDVQILARIRDDLLCGVRARSGL